ncbi:MAG: transcriptional regulator [Propionibacteriaceae bacterium]|nr:transcriptional regulator [Propionibacteriaceae bacterium]
METTEEVFAAFAAAEEPLKSGQVAEILGADKKEVDTAIKALKAEGKLVSPKRCFYEPAE